MKTKLFECIWCRYQCEVPLSFAAFDRWTSTTQGVIRPNSRYFDERTGIPDVRCLFFCLSRNLFFCQHPKNWETYVELPGKNTWGRKIDCKLRRVQPTTFEAVLAQEKTRRSFVATSRPVGKPFEKRNPRLRFHLAR